VLSRIVTDITWLLLPYPLCSADYSNPHEDMQTIITEYVPNNPPEDAGGSYANVALLQAAVAAGKAAEARRWDVSDIQAALGDISGMAAPAAASSDNVACVTSCRAFVQCALYPTVP
jgi:hypothetical protein